MLELYPHNERAYEAAMCVLEQSGKAAIIHPTGTGKSFIGFKLAKEHPTGTRFVADPERLHRADAVAKCAGQQRMAAG